MRSGARVDQLTGYADPIGALAHRTLEHIPNTQFAAEPLHIDVLPLVGEARIAGDDGKPADPREGGGDLLDHPVGEILLLQVTAEIVERQDRQRRLLRHRQAVRGSGVASGRRFRCTEQPVASPGNGHNPVFRVPVFLKHFAQRRDVDLKVVLLDDDPSPHSLHQLVFGDDFAPR